MIKKLCKWSVMSFLVMVLPTLVACGSDDDDDKGPSLDKTNISLYVDEAATLTYSGGNCVWSSDNELIASVKDGIITAKHVGTTKIHANDLTCEVTVKPKYTSFFEPCIQWGASQSVVKNFMSSYTLRSSSDTQLVYNSSGRVTGYMYSFENAALKSSAFGTGLSHSSSLTDFLLERYVVLQVDEEDYMVYMCSVDENTIIGMSITTSGIIVVYLPRTGNSTRSYLQTENMLNLTIRESVPLLTSNKVKNINNADLSKHLERFIIASK